MRPARAKAIRVPPARIAVSRVVAETDKPRTWPPIGLEQDVLHGESGSAQTNATRAGARAASLAEHRATRRGSPALAVLGRSRAGSRASCFHSAMTLSTIVAAAAPWITWIRRSWLKSASSRPNTKRAHHHADQQHDRQQRDDARARSLRREVGGERQARRSASCAGPRRPAGRRSRRQTCPTQGGAAGVARQHDQREGHDREAAELDQGAEPDVRHPPPAQHRAIGVRAEADQRAQRREHQRQRDHQRRPARPTRRVRRSSPGSACRSAAPSPCRPRPGTATGATAAPSGSSAVAASAKGSRSRPTRVQPRARACVELLIARAAPSPGRCRSRDAIARAAAAAPGRQRRVARRSAARSASSATGSIAGARSPRGKSGRPHASRSSSGVRGAKVNRIAGRVRAASACTARRPCRRRGSGSGSPSRPHGRTRRAPGRACRRRAKSIAPAPGPAAALRASSTRVGETSIATTSAPRRAASTASAPVPQPASSMRSPRRSAGSQDEQRRAHRVAPGAHGGADAG